MMLPVMLVWSVLLQTSQDDVTASDGAAAASDIGALVASPETPTDDEADAIQLSFPDAIGLALRNNLSLESARLATESAYAGYGSTWGVFDTSTFLSLTRSETVSAPTPNNFVGGVNLGGTNSTEFDLLTWRTGLTGTLQTGTTWTFGVGPRFSRVHTTSPSTGAEIVSDTHTADWSLELSQPLLRGGADEYAWSGIRLAAQDVAIAVTDSETAASNVLLTVITSYWNLLYSRQNLATRERSVDLANELLQITQRKKDQGLQNRLDVLEAEAEVANRGEELLTARNALAQAEDDLRLAVFGSGAQRVWDRAIVPTTDYQEASESFLGPINPADVRIDDAVLLALQNRPDVRSARLALERARLAKERAETDALPKFDVTASYGLNSNQPSDTRALEDLYDTSFHEARVMLDFSMPIGNRSAGYVVRQRDLDAQRATVALNDRSLSAEAEVRAAVRRLQLDRQRILATAETRRLREEAYEGEKRRLENDLSTPFKVRESQRDYLEALDNEVRAQLDLAISWTSLLQAMGSLPHVFGYRPVEPSLSEDAPPPAP